jgi:hypothetical protein
MDVPLEARTKDMALYYTWSDFGNTSEIEITSIIEELLYKTIDSTNERSVSRVMRVICCCFKASCCSRRHKCCDIIVASDPRTEQAGQVLNGNHWCVDATFLGAKRNLGMSMIS